MGSGEETRRRILDAAHASVVAKGFGATSIEEIIAAAGITRSAFLGHFRDEAELAEALLRRSLDEDDWVLDDAFARARDLVDDPLQVLLTGLRLLADRMAEMPRGHPGSLVAASCCCEQPFGAAVQAINRAGALRWRARFRSMFDEIVALHPPREAIGADDFADMVATLFEGGIVMAKALGDPSVLPRQIMVLRTNVKLLFAPEARASGAA